MHKHDVTTQKPNYILADVKNLTIGKNCRKRNNIRMLTVGLERIECVLVLTDYVME